MLQKVRARVGYLIARKLMASRWVVQQPKLWRWMEGQFSRMAALGNSQAQSFYGHILLFRGQGYGAKKEGIRLLRLAAEAGDAAAFGETRDRLTPPGQASKIEVKLSDAFNHQAIEVFETKTRLKVLLPKKEAGRQGVTINRVRGD